MRKWLTNNQTSNIKSLIESKLNSQVDVNKLLDALN